MKKRQGFQIVVGLDGSPQSLVALEWALTEARLRSGRVRVVTAWQYPATGFGLNVPIWDVEAISQDAQNIQDEALKDAVADGVDISREILQGPPAPVLLEAAKDADLLIVGSRGRGGFTGLLLGSVSGQVVQHATCPVLVVHG